MMIQLRHYGHFGDVLIQYNILLIRKKGTFGRNKESLSFVRNI